MVRGRFRLSVAAAGRTLATGRPADLPKRATSTSPERGDISRRTTHGIDTQGAGIVSGAVRRATRRPSTRGTRSANGPARSATRACRSRPGTGGCSTSPRRRQSKTYCDEVRGIARRHGVEITELSTHLQGQLVAVHPAFDEAFDAFAPPAVHGKPKERQEWAVEQMMLGRQGLAQSRPCRRGDLLRRARLALRLSLAAAAGRPHRRGLRANSRGAGSRSSTPMTRSASTSATRSIPARTCSTARPSRCSSTKLKDHPRCAINYDPSHFLLQQLDYLDFIDIYHERIKAFHVKDAEFNPNGRQGVYSGYQSWVERAGRFRSLGDGQVDFAGIFSKLAQYGYDSWAVLEWECCLKHPEDGRARGRPLHRQPHHPRDREGLRRLCRRGHRSQEDPSHAGAEIDRGGHRTARRSAGQKAGGRDGHRRTIGRQGGRADPPRHGGRRRGRLHRRGASPRRAHGRQLRLRGGRAVLDARKGAALRRGARARSGAHLSRLRRPWRRRSGAGRTASRRWRSSRRTTCMRRRPRPSSRPASTSSATSR